ncbi:hypothetical protein QTH97_30645 [Variovorax sp. J22R24]|uniref:hypothetical protein n=1 Tax=Variovorax gracilis TaxID=3053502 RepID=UPI002578C257|nr:hypothetical protein [Variovorax sp. J22R24]MDM0109325.1 hypothetical protein [Variovorax sp. J22R24]
MGFTEILEDFAACVAVAARVAPDRYPGWSSGWKGNLEEMMSLWNEIRPLLRRDVEQAQRIDSVLQEMVCVAEAGDTSGFQRAARALHGFDLLKLR